MPPLDIDIVREYERGLQGFVPNPGAITALDAYLQEHGGYASAADAIDDYQLRDSGKDKLSLPYLAALSIYPGCLPGGYQKRGSCVAWSTRNAALVSYCAYLMYGQNSEKYAPPVVSPTAVANGVASTEGIYWFRQHGGDGWDCASAAQVVIEKCGLLLRKAYPEIGLDLTVYSPATEGKWGATQPPPSVRDECDNHLVGNATVCKSWEEVRDMLANGYALSTCGGESFSHTRNEDGVCFRTPEGWAHAMAFIAADDRPDTVAKYGCGLVLVQNSWPAQYLSGPRVVRGTSIEIPESSFWAKWTDVRNRYCVALGPSKGWPAGTLPNWGLEGVI